ncbi:MAG: hypothetical protein ACYC7J_09885 [Syntrophales bacterium]
METLHDKINSSALFHTVHGALFHTVRSARKGLTVRFFTPSRAFSSFSTVRFSTPYIEYAIHIRFLWVSLFTLFLSLKKALCRAPQIRVDGRRSIEGNGGDDMNEEAGQAVSRAELIRAILDNATGSLNPEGPDFDKNVRELFPFLKEKEK